jgi:hypothetical protein
MPTTNPADTFEIFNPKRNRYEKIGQLSDIQWPTIRIIGASRGQLAGLVWCFNNRRTLRCRVNGKRVFLKISGVNPKRW